MNKLESLKSLYKPYRYTIKGNCTILETTSGNFVVKKKPKNKDLPSIFNYLKSRNFDYFPNIYGDSRDDAYVYEYVEDERLISTSISGPAPLKSVIPVAVPRGTLTTARSF